MFRSMRHKVFLAMICLCGGLISAEAKTQAQGIHLSNGKLYNSGERLPGTFSLIQSKFEYLYVYVPDRGLFVIANHAFGGAEQAGAFEGRELKLETAGIQFSLHSSQNLLGHDPEPAWVKYDSTFATDKPVVVLGYGDTDNAPYEWPAYTNRDHK